MLTGQYQPKDLEQSLYQHWENSGYFKPSGKGGSYSIVIPPPNVTGTLHMGHGFQQTIMDVLTRYHRMQGDNTLWQAGADHAGIATQMVVERQLLAQGKSRHDLGREAFVAKIWEWKEQSGGTINQQIRRLGASLDWSTYRFTMDDDLSHAVREVFIQLYEEGLIYRGQRLVNWDPVLLTAISDLEVVAEEQEGKMYHIRYPICDSDAFLTVATTRPETLLGDSAIAVHPDDARYQALIGKQVRLPLCDRTIPVIADEYVDPEFGTGCVKITPAHDFNDYEVGQRHDLPLINILTPDAQINDQAPKAYQGLERFKAREKIIEDLSKEHLLEKIEKHILKVPKGDRSGAVIEPYLTHQWFVKAKELAKPAIDAVEQGEIRFVPEQWNKTYFQWMNNIQDWCISRQIWWGHRVPVWYDDANNIYVGHDLEDIKQKYKLPENINLQQDTDVLDTWFSSALWPFATLGWPNKTEELATFYPTSVLVTGFDIIFFWVARMIMMGLKFTGKIPFHEVYITGLIRDHEGQKMSKTKGNILDPIDLIDGIDLETLIKKRTFGLMQPEMAKNIESNTRSEFPSGINPHGTDALRFTFCALANNSRDIRFDLGRLEGYRNFCNKLWNAARFVFLQIDNTKDLGEGECDYSLADRWIQSCFQKTISDVNKQIKNYRFDYVAQSMYEFVWHEFCDWYLELVKVVLNNNESTDAQKRGARQTLISMLDHVLRLLHPLMPFITEHVWLQLKPYLNTQVDSIMLASYPKENDSLRDEHIESSVTWLKEFILSIRKIRSEINLAPGKPVHVVLSQLGEIDQQYLNETQSAICVLARFSRIDVLKHDDEKPTPAMTALLGQMEIHVPLKGLIDTGAEKIRLTKEIEQLKKEQERIEKKLSNPQFIERAPEVVVNKEREKLFEYQTAEKQFQEKLISLE